MVETVPRAAVDWIRVGNKKVGVLSPFDDALSLLRLLFSHFSNALQQKYFHLLSDSHNQQLFKRENIDDVSGILFLAFLCLICNGDRFLL
ncbi:hypothetical protein [Polycladomyces subterraneus]|uniref:Uncharacterized protein n=1 Tax=Polycladomyces subterraneus TaxID=1016997 RepID=A0ABT8IML6_9BACL|nr:hypothetical protein [Polycladomyces subterraneus]MDN4593997.1 hypothetical protein [Polycladomyces subterraneus]